MHYKELFTHNFIDSRLQSYVGKLKFRISRVLSDSTIRTIRDFLQLNPLFPPYAFIHSHTRKNSYVINSVN